MAIFPSDLGGLGEALSSSTQERTGSNPVGNRSFFRIKFMFTLFKYYVNESNLYIVVLAQWEHADLPIQRLWVRVDFSVISFSHQI